MAEASRVNRDERHDDRLWLLLWLWPCLRSSLKRVDCCRVKVVETGDVVSLARRAVVAKEEEEQEKVVGANGCGSGETSRLRRRTAFISPQLRTVR